MNETSYVLPHFGLWALGGGQITIPSDDADFECAVLQQPRPRGE